MTDKQIIIDVCPYQGECSVSGCKRNDDGCFVRQLFEERNRAENRIVELNKSIQDKEQECDMWKNLTVDNGAVALKYQQQLDQLKAENDELKGIRDRNFLHALEEQEKANKLKQTLTELGTILTHCMQQDICTTCDYSEECNLGDEEIPTYDICKFLLNKINQHQ